MPTGSVLARGLGAPDIALSIGGLGALRRKAEVGPWLRAAALAEAADSAAAPAVVGRLPARQRIVATAGPALLAAVALGLARRR